MTAKESIRDAETKIEETLNNLEGSQNIRAFRIQVLSERGQKAQVTITPDVAGGRFK